MVLKMLNYFGNGKNWNVRWPTSNITEGFCRDVIPVSIRLKSNVKTPRGLYIVKRAERSLLNERIRSVNNMINMLNIQRGTCMDQLKTCLDGRTMEECELFINRKRESRCNSTLVRQLHKFEQLHHKNKIQGGLSNIWKNKMATQTSEMNKKKTKMGHKCFKYTINRSAGKTTSPWAKLCSCSRTPTHNRSDNIGGEDMPEDG